MAEKLQLTICSGIITVVWGFIGLFVIPDSPANTRALWLTKPEREVARQRMSRQGTTVAEKISGKALRRKLVFMFKSPLTYFFIAAYLQFAWSQRVNSYFLLFLKVLYTHSFIKARLKLMGIFRDSKTRKERGYTAPTKST